MADIQKEIAALLRLTQINRQELEDLHQRVQELHVAIQLTREANAQAQRPAQKQPSQSPQAKDKTHRK